MEAHAIEPKEEVNASKKLGRDHASEMAAAANKLIVAKGKKVSTFDIKTKVDDEAIDAMLGPTGNMRAPTMRVGKTLVVGFNDETYESVLL